jgi:Protein of unknown function (DUF2934)
MASRICCQEGHSTKAVAVWEAAVALSEGRAIGTCKKCAKALQYKIDHVYANDPDETEHSYVVTRAVRLNTGLKGEESFDPFLLVLREVETGKEHLLPTYWAFGQTGAHRAGYLAPILRADQWTKLFGQAGVAVDDAERKIRERAYQLYERRGRVNGYALEDWLRAEAEIANRSALQAAA